MSLTRFFVGVTDNTWFDNLSRLQPDEVNFWRPSGKVFKTLEIGAPFLFKLHSPKNYIVGGGFFIRFEQLPLSLAWDAFGEKNGAYSLKELRNLIHLHRGAEEHDPVIGCIILNEPFFFPKNQWIPTPVDWSSNIVTGKTYDTNINIGWTLWESISQRLSFLRTAEDTNASFYIAKDGPVYGNEYLVKSRLGQGAFRILVTSAYKRRCAITGEKTLPVLQAAHIKPISESGPNRINNGLLLRSDLHILFEKGYLTVTPDNHVEVSRKIKEDYDNGKEYYPLHGRRLVVLPEIQSDWPRKDFLEWHNTERYLG